MDFATSDHYVVLGVDRTATEADINKAYKDLARRHHPDKNPNNRAEAELRFKRLAEAYAILRDPEARRQYDLSGSNRSNLSYEEAERMWRSWGMGADGPEGAAEAAGRVAQDEGRRKGVVLVLVLLSMFAAPQWVMRLLPGMTAAVVGIALLSRREGQPARWAWWALLLLLVTYLAPMALRLRTGIGAQPLEDAQIPQGGAMAAGGPAVVGVPHSGEVVFMEDGQFALLSDPSKLVGEAPSAGWQQRLLGEMTSSIRRGQEQVVMVFSREGCPWCDRQLPVLERAIQRRAGAGQVGNIAAPGVVVEAETEPTPVFALPRLLGRAALGASGGPVVTPPVGLGTNLLSAPLRVFVFDAGEFPGFAQTFRVEAFPTTIAWGAPGVTPMAAQGYLDDSNFDQLLRTVATAPPGEPNGKKSNKKRGLFR